MTDRGILTETPAILVFIAQSFPVARLAPLDDAFAFARVQAFNPDFSKGVAFGAPRAVRGALDPLREH